MAVGMHGALNIQWQVGRVCWQRWSAVLYSMSLRVSAASKPHGYCPYSEYCTSFGRVRVGYPVNRRSPRVNCPRVAPRAAPRAVLGFASREVQVDLKSIA